MARFCLQFTKGIVDLVRWMPLAVGNIDTLAVGPVQAGSAPSITSPPSLVKTASLGVRPCCKSERTIRINNTFTVRCQCCRPPANEVIVSEKVVFISKCRQCNHYCDDGPRQFFLVIRMWPDDLLAADLFTTIADSCLMKTIISRTGVLLCSKHRLV